MSHFLGSFRYASTGGKIKNANWNFPDAPNNGGEFKFRNHCAAMNTTSSQWWDVHCDSHRSFLCEGYLNDF